MRCAAASDATARRERPWMIVGQSGDLIKRYNDTVWFRVPVNLEKSSSRHVSCGLRVSQRTLLARVGKHCILLRSIDLETVASLSVKRFRGPRPAFWHFIPSARQRCVESKQSVPLLFHWGVCAAYEFVGRMQAVVPTVFTFGACTAFCHANGRRVLVLTTQRL